LQVGMLRGYKSKVGMVGIVGGWTLENELKVGVWSKNCIYIYIYIYTYYVKCLLVVDLKLKLSMTWGAMCLFT
jgi:hypothetical protein